MRFVSTIMVWLGYTLVYAAVAAGGKFATEPWAGLFADAYTENQDPTAKLSPADTGWSRITPNPPAGTHLKP